jgi:hypothetical protein
LYLYLYPWGTLEPPRCRGHLHRRPYLNYNGENVPEIARNKVGNGGQLQDTIYPDGDLCLIHPHPAQAIWHGCKPLLQAKKLTLRPGSLASERKLRRKFCLFCTSKGDLALMSCILHSALGAVTRDQNQNSSQHRGCVMHDRRIE